jgi:hypothetical protein
MLCFLIAKHNSFARSQKPVSKIFKISDEPEKNFLFKTEFPIISRKVLLVHFSIIFQIYIISDESDFEWNRQKRPEPEFVNV